MTTKDLARLGCEDLATLERILLTLGKTDAAKKVHEVAVKKGCLVQGSAITGELIL